jgi:DNA-binding NarL/FixJ family response regulator
MGVRKLDSLIIAELEQIRDASPQVAIVVLLTVYDVESMKIMKKLVSRGKAGMAVFLKQSVERLEQLYGVVESVYSGSVILDPALTSLLLADKQEHPFFKEFTRRELELLSLLSRGYTNSAIAEALCIDIRTVQRHINNMYSKLRADTNFKERHLRVSAARFYLENTGELQANDAQQPEAVGPALR